MDRLPDRSELGLTFARVAFSPVELRPNLTASYRVIGAWEVHSEDPRLGGVSALAVDGDQLVALTDSGVLIRLRKPHARVGAAFIRELPDGPGDPRHKRGRDSEALLRDPQGRGWWVAFENRNQLWLYDRDFGRATARLALPGNFGRNRGVEALASDRGALLILPEDGRSVIRMHGRSIGGRPILVDRGRISDAARLPNGELWVVQRRLTLGGFVNALAALRPVEGGYRYGATMRLPLSPLDNVEAMAAELLPNGRTRLWLATDDNLWRPLRTLLVAIDLPPERRDS